MPTAPVIDHRHLRSAIEFAVLVCKEMGRRKPGLKVPGELKAFVDVQRIPTGALGRLRRAVESDDVFRRRVAAGALPEIVDDVGRLWLDAADGWEGAAAALIAEREAERARQVDQAALTRSEKRRTAAEDVARRAQSAIVGLTARLEESSALADVLHADLAKADDEVASLRAELTDARIERRHALDREAAAVARLEAERDARRDLVVHGDPEPEPADKSDAIDAATLQLLRDEILAAHETAQALADRLAAAMPRDVSAEPDIAAGRKRTKRLRSPLKLPGGVSANSTAAADFLARSGAPMIIDGYNVAMLGWPALTLEGQRLALVEAVENLAKRFGTDATIVFDGSKVVGAHSPKRRVIRVMFSPDGVSADDTIRDIVRSAPPADPIVVVTNDAEIIRDVRALGANVIASNVLLKLT